VCHAHFSEEKLMTQPNETAIPEKRVERDVDYMDADLPRPFFGPILTTLKPYRTVIGSLLGLAAVFVVAAGFALWSRSPVQKRATLDFRIDFDGIQDGKYPNGTKFSVEDLLSEPVLRRVYGENGLQKYATFERFQRSLVVTSSNKERELLEMEYKTRLADAKLGPIDRQRTEREFQEKSAALKTSTFSLTLVRAERLLEMDAALIEKVLRGVLNAWADDAAKIRGAVKYDLPTLSRAMIHKDLLQSEDYLFVIDMLRTTINRVIASVDQLLKVPGIQVVRLPGSGVSLPEIRIRLEDLNTLRIAPAIGLIRVMGLSKNLSSTLLYIDSRLFDVNLNQKLAQDRERKVRDGFEVYAQTETRNTGSVAGKNATGAEGSVGTGREFGTAAVIPQFGESFIDRLMQLANRNSDVTFRQDLTERIIAAGLAQVDYAKETAFYKDLEAAFKSRTQPVGDSASRASALKEVESRFTSATEELGKDLDDIQALYELVSARNLRPASFLYTAERPMVMDSTSAFAFSRYFVLAVLFVGFVGFAAAVVALGHARLRADRG
jgi:hypothetical protein